MDPSCMSGMVSKNTYEMFCTWLQKLRLGSATNKTQAIHVRSPADQPTGPVMGAPLPSQLALSPNQLVTVAKSSKPGRKSENLTAAR